MYYGTRTMLGVSFSPPFVSLDLFVQQARPTDSLQVLISLLVLHAAPYNLAQKWTSLRPINAIKSAPLCCGLMELLEYLRFPAQNSIGCNVNLRTHFQQDALPRFQWLPFMFADITDMRMRINLQHPGYFRLAAIGVKNVFLLNVWRPIVPVLFCWPHPGLCRRVGMHGLYKRSKAQLNRMRNRRVIRGQNIRHSILTLDCKFEPDLTFTDRDETGARRKVWTKDSLGPSAQKFLSPHFRVMAPENLYLPMFDP